MQAATLVAVLCTLAFFNGVQSLEWAGLSRCTDRIKPMKNFDITKYAGRWFEIRRGGLMNEFNGSCIQTKYTPNLDGNIDVKIAMMNEESHKLETIEGEASLTDNSGAGILDVTLFYNDGKTRPSLYWSVLDTDYENYAVVHSCVNLRGIYRDEAWILSREADLSNATLIKAEEVLKAFDLYTDSQDVQNCGVIV